LLEVSVNGGVPPECAPQPLIAIAVANAKPYRKYLKRFDLILTSIEVKSRST
jgi:hypothetical protein